MSRNRYLESMFHRDGSVTLWNVFLQRWVRYSADEPPSDEVYASLGHMERTRVLKHLRKSQGGEERAEYDGK